MKESERKPEYIKSPKRNTTRRAVWHDYCAPAIYLITLSKRPEAPDFGILSSGGPVVFLTEVGRTLRDALLDINRHHPQAKLIAEVVMPDHIHFVIQIRERLQRPLGTIIQKFKSNATHQARLRLGNPGLEIFKPNFNDRILSGRDQLDAMIRYVSDNPRRLWIRRCHPNLFQRINHLMINGIEFLAFGNLFLLRDALRCPVMIHRSLTIDEKRILAERWMEVIRSGGVLVSPFISTEEKAVRDRAIANGGKLIIISQQAVGERFKPAGQEFELCAQGRLLVLFPWADRVKNHGLSRAEALWMNRMAEIICEPGAALSFSPGSLSSAVHGR